MKKNTTKILMAALALFMAIGIATGTTFAWFALNTYVTASGMQIEAKSDSTYLLIGTGDNDTASEIQAINPASTSVTLTVDEDVFPSSPAMTAAEAAYLTTSGKDVTGTTITTAGVVVDNAAKAAAVTNWFTANALTSGAAAIDTASARQLTSFTNYVVVQQFFLTVTVGSETAYNLTVTPTITQYSTGTDVSAVKFLVTTSDGGYAAISTANNGSAVDISGSNSGLDDNEVITVTLYIYYDGDETPVYTNNKANLTGATIAVRFDVDTTVPTP